ncbi:DNA-directed RNA polymerase subunit A'' [Candidatus Woesearchaeota archaeon]|nr:DNA-directed RNA polymerase subunit A'' [Candidatus Woesearchaeota archaeon]
MPDIYQEYQEILPKKVFDEVREECKNKRLTVPHIKKVFEAVKKAYEDAKINPGEAIGIVTAESIGEPGTQMSLLHSEKIIVKSNNNIKIVKIGKFVDELMNRYGSIDMDFTEVTPINNLELYSISMNNNEKVEWKKITEVSRHKYNKDLMKLTTKSGRKIIATDNHSFVIRSNNKIIPITGRDLKVGNRIPTINNFFTDSLLKEVKIGDSFIDKKIIIENDIISKSGAKSIKNSIELNWNTGWFIGAYLAEGYNNLGTTGISNINDNYISNGKEFADYINITPIERHYVGEYGPGRTLTISSTFLSKFIAATCGRGSNYKKIPEFAYSASNEFVKGLLRGYFDGDGNFHVSRKMIRASSNSKELMDGIALLLSRFKIFSYKVKDKKGQYWLLIPYKYAPLYLEFIGSDIDYKFSALEELAELAKKFWNEKSQDYNDMVAGFGDLFYITAKKLGFPTRYINNFTKRQKIGRTALFKYTKIFENLAKQKNIDISKELEMMQRMFNSDVVWDEIISIDYIKSEHEFVYDLSVPELSTFTTFDGIITHNTLNTFHFSGVAEMNITVGLPRLIEIFDARKTPTTPRMEVYLKSKYSHDPKMARKIAAQIKETKLKEIATEFSINLAKASIESKLDHKRLKELGIKEEQLVAILTQNFKNVAIKIERDNIVLYPKLKEYDLGEVFKLKEKVKEAYVSGIKGITQVLPIKQESEFIILCAGSNLKDMLKLEEIDARRTTTNDISEIEKVLGIEAARQAIINEALKVIEDQGLDIDIRHLMFLADVMTVTGTVKGITRSGITSEKQSVLARASFETPIKHIINAALTGERDPLNSVVENVMLNQPVPLGTGMPQLVMKTKKK